MRLMPYYLIQLISKWVYIHNEQIHLIDSDHGMHWKIDINHILNNIQ